MSAGYAAFDATIVAAEALVGLRSELVYGNLANRQYEGQIKGIGSTVRIPNLSRPTVAAYVPNTTVVTPELVSQSSVSLVCDQAQHFSFYVDDVDAAFGAGGVAETLTREAVYAIADAIDAQVASVAAAGVASGNTIGSTGTPQVWDSLADVKADLIGMRTKLTQAGVPSAGRWVVLPPEAIAYLLTDNAQLAPANSDAVANGIVGRAFGFDIYESNNVPVSSGKFSIVAGTSEAVTAAVAVNSVELYRPESSFSDAVKGLAVWGSKVARTDGLAKVIATIA